MARLAMTELGMRGGTLTVVVVQLAAAFVALLLQSAQLRLSRRELFLRRGEVRLQRQQLGLEGFNLAFTPENTGARTVFVGDRHPVAPQPYAGARDHRLLRRQLCAHGLCLGQAIGHKNIREQARQIGLLRPHLVEQGRTAGRGACSAWCTGLYHRQFCLLEIFEIARQGVQALHADRCEIRAEHPLDGLLPTRFHG